MKEWHRTVLLTLIILAGIAYIVWTNTQASNVL